MNNGFWANFIEICNKINNSTDTEIKKHFTGTINNQVRSVE